jgi:hypothetical protein
MFSGRFTAYPSATHTETHKHNIAVLFLTTLYLYHTQYDTATWKVKQSDYRPGQTLRAPGIWGSHISRQLSHEGGKVISLTPGLLYTQEVFMLLISVRGWDNPRAIVRPEGLCQWKIPMPPSIIETAAFRLLAQSLNKLRAPTLTYTVKLNLINSQAKLRHVSVSATTTLRPKHIAIRRCLSYAQIAIFRVSPSTQSCWCHNSHVGIDVVGCAVGSGPPYCHRCLTLKNQT